MFDRARPTLADCDQFPAEFGQTWQTSSRISAEIGPMLAICWHMLGDVVRVSPGVDQGWHRFAQVLASSAESGPFSPQQHIFAYRSAR